MSDLVSQLNAIKDKLEQYSKSNNDAKVNEYLDKLGTVQMTIDLLKKTELGKTIQKLKKLEQSYSKKASELIKKWKSLIAPTTVPDNESLSQSTQPKKRLSSTQITNKLPEKKQKISFNDYLAKKGDILQATSATSSQSDIANSSFESEIFKNELELEESINNKPSLPLPKSIIESLVQGTTVSNKNTQIKSTNDDISKFLTSKQSKRLIYSGKKETITHVSKLYDLSIKVLVCNIEDLPQKIYIYNLNNVNKLPIPFDLVKPVIERANAKQLENIESYSPDFVAHTDYIWKKLSQQEFKNQIPDEDESWRELYFRKLDEREEALQRARALVSSRQAQKPTGRMTQQVLSVKSSSHKTKISISQSKSLDVVPLKSRNAQSIGSKKPFFNGSTSNAPKQEQGSKGALMAKTMKMMKNLRR